MAMRIETFAATLADQPQERQHLAMLTIIRANGRADICMPFFASTAPVALGNAEAWWSDATAKAAASGAARTAGNTNTNAGNRPYTRKKASGKAE